MFEKIEVLVNEIKEAVLNIVKITKYREVLSLGVNMENERILQKKLDCALDEAVSSIYFSDRSEHRSALWSIIRVIGGDEAVDLLVSNERAAFEKYTKVGRDYKEGK